MNLHAVNAALLLAGLATPFASHALSAPVEDVASFLGTTLAQMEAINPMSGEVDESGREGVMTRGVAMSRVISVQAGDTLSFDWFFGTEEVFANNGVLDFGFFSLDGVLTPLANSGDAIESTEDGDDSTFSPFPHHLPQDNGAYFRTHTVTFDTAGEHHIGFAVVDTVDTVVRTGLVLDRVSINGTLLDNGGFEDSEFDGTNTHFFNWQALGDVSPWDNWPPAPEGSVGAALISGDFEQTPVPLPAGVWLLGSALGALAWRGRRRG
ncbi:MAG: VPLPA-CTERM sorting domain-containing protein [Gammaproteobacteria bacterium]